jgi:hypothetical protein
MSTEEGVRWILMAGVIPLWILAGLADWACHWRTRIERTSGLTENIFHWVLLGEAGVAVLAAALLEPTAGVLLLVFAAFLAHELTTWVELRYTAPLREIQPVEQMVHSFMEMLPLVMLALLAVVQWEGLRTPDWDLRAKGDPWPPEYLAGAALAVLLFNVLPMAEEGVRCWRARGAA